MAIQAQPQQSVGQTHTTQRNAPPWGDSDPTLLAPEHHWSGLEPIQVPGAAAPAPLPFRAVAITPPELVQLRGVSQQQRCLVDWLHGVRLLGGQAVCFRGLWLSRMLHYWPALQRLCSKLELQTLINAPQLMELAACPQTLQDHPPAAFHLKSSDRPAPWLAGQGYSWGQSVHSMAEALHAQNCGAHYLFFSPVYATRSHPGQTPAGPDALEEVANTLRLPVFALGGLTPERCNEVLECGAWGLAGIGLFQQPQG